MQSAYPFTGRSILLVEDELLIALETAELFESAGAQVVSVRTHAQARAAIDAGGISAAVLDYRLGEDNVAELCVVLEWSGIPYMFYSGYGGDLRASFPKDVILSKPATGEALISAMTGLLSSPTYAAEVTHRSASRQGHLAAT
jgi:DNA-binding response OmpR family regulator